MNKPEPLPFDHPVKTVTDMDYQKTARGLVVDFFNDHSEKTDAFILDIDDVYVVWFVKVLQNAKMLISTNVPDGMYYEVTFNGDKNEVYVDAYKKVNNQPYSFVQN